MPNAILPTVSFCQEARLWLRHFIWHGCRQERLKESYGGYMKWMPCRKYLNRLSDLFFIMARFELQQSEHKEEIWREFGYKRKLK